MSQSGIQRGLIALANMRLSERDIRALHEFTCEINATAFIEVIRDLEDEMQNSSALIFERTREQSFFASEFEEFYRELDVVRKKELRMSVLEFADALTSSLRKSSAKDADIPSFDSRRGLQAWLKKLVRRYPEAEVYHSVMRIRHDQRKGGDSDWALR